VKGSNLHLKRRAEEEGHTTTKSMSGTGGKESTMKRDSNAERSAFRSQSSALSPLVSVLITAYNHENYIAETLDAVLMQQCDFDYEIVVGEDASSDRTRDILLEYQKQNPKRIRLIFHDRAEAEHDRSLGLGGKRNFVQTLEACRGTFVAVLDGDDYWTSPKKLQKQADFLKAHQDYSMGCHRAAMIDERGNIVNLHPAEETNESLGIEDLLESNFVNASSVMFRRGLFGEFPAWHYDMPIGDWTLHVLNAEHGKIGYMNEVMANYRIHSTGNWSGTSAENRREWLLRFYEHINEQLDFRYDKIIAPKLFLFRYSMATEAAARGDRKTANSLAAKCFTARPFHKHWTFRVKLFIKLYTPRFFRKTFEPVMVFFRTRLSAR
jgi:glycosyltransferase involved in cell wall biosynthesis